MPDPLLDTPPVPHQPSPQMQEKAIRAVSTTMPEDTYRPETQNKNASKAVLIITADNTEDLEFFYPYYRFLEAGFRVDVATPKGGKLTAKHGLSLNQTLKISDVKPNDYVLLYVPGGKAPAELKKNLEALELVRQFAISEKPIAAICHGPQLLAAANLLDKRKITAWPEIKNEVVEAGALFVNQETAVDGPFVTARWPGDLPAHMKRVLEMLGQGKSSVGGTVHEAA